MRIGHFLTLLFGIACTGTLEAGSDLPYDVVVTNVLGPGPGMVRVDLDSGEQTPIGGASGPVLATAADGSIYTVTGGTVLGETTLSGIRAKS